MTSCASNWLSRTFRNRPSRVCARRFAPPRPEALESRNLLNGAWSFVSAPQLQPMKVNVLAHKANASLNPIFVDPYDQTPDPSTLVGQTGPLIMDGSGNPIWFHPLSNNNSVLAVDFQTQTLFGKPVLTWWQGSIAGITPSDLPAGTPLQGGRFVVYNQNYKQIMSVRAPKGFSMDEHEFLITPKGDAYFIALKTVKADLTPYGGTSDGAFEDPVIQEVNMRTGKPIFSWNTAAHIPLSDSVVPAPTTPGQLWDPYHANSIDASADGSQLLLSMRNTWGIYDVSRGSGQVLWQIGGKQNQFSLPSSLVTGPFGSAFQYQHDVRFVPGGISLFDNGGLGGPPDSGPYGASRGLILNLDLQSHTASLANPPYVHDPAIGANSQGDLQVLGNGNVFVGWGSDAEPAGAVGSSFTEYSSDGSVLADFSLAGQDVTYRALTAPWLGIPLAKPAATAIAANGQVTVYASWNGSTQTAAWQLLAGPSRTSLVPVATASSTGFETAISTAAAEPFYEVKALDAAGDVLKTSAVISAQS